MFIIPKLEILLEYRSITSVDIDNYDDIFKSVLLENAIKFEKLYHE